jgi:hypothetical protein
MESATKSSILRIYISSTDKDGHQPLSESIVFKAREAGIAGATVIKGVLGFGASSVIHSYKFWEVTEKVPMVVEIIDSDDKIDAFYERIRPLLEEMRYGCMVIRENADVLLVKSGKKKKF